MKYVWTYWTKPQNKKTPLLDIAMFGLSVATASKHSIIKGIYTDSDGAKQIEKFCINAPTFITLDHLQNEDPAKWAISKIDTFSKIEEPCVHIDHDVFLWTSQKSRKTDFCCQSLEKNNFYTVFYSRALSELGGKDVWPYYKRFKEHSFCGYNMGYIEINNIEFMKKYTKESFSVYEKIKINHRSQNIIPEQYLFYCMTHSDPSIKVDVLIKPPFTHEHQALQCYQLGYTHLMGEKFIQTDVLYNRIKDRLSAYNPYCLEKLLEAETKSNYCLLNLD